MSKYDELVEGLHQKKVKPLGLPPRLSGSIKAAMYAAAKESKGDAKETRKAIKAYLTEKGYDPETGKKIDKPKGKRGRPPKVKPEKVDDDEDDEDEDDEDDEEDDEEEEEETEADEEAKTSKKPSPTDPAKKKLKNAGGKAALKGDSERKVPVGNIDLTKLDRRTLRGIAKSLGKYNKAWTDEETRTAIAKNLVGMDDAALAKISKADPSKIEGLDNCVGVLLDLTNAVCVTCPAQSDCRKAFELHRKDGFKIFDNLKPDVPVEKLLKNTKPEFAIVVKKLKKVAKLPTVKDGDGDDIDNSEHGVFLKKLKKANPTTRTDFDKVVLASYDPSDDDKDGSKLTAWCFDYVTKLGVLK